MPAGSDAGGEKSFAGACASMGVSAGAILAAEEKAPVGQSIQVKSALVETRSTRLTWTNFLDSYKAGRVTKAPAIAAQGIAMVVAIRVIGVMRFMSRLFLKRSSLEVAYVCASSRRDLTLRTTKGAASRKLSHH